MKNIEDLYELSPAQLGVFYRSLSVPGSGEDVDQIGFVLEGPLDTQAFREAWRRAVQLHAVLRTSFHWKNIAKPVQAVRREVALPWEEEDWRGVPAGEHEARLAALLAADRGQAFDLGTAPLMRLRLIHAAERKHLFLWSFHYALLDERSAARVLRQVLAPDAAPPPSRPYRDYILWLQRQEEGEAQAFWREALRGVDAPTPLPEEPGGTAPASRQARLRLTRQETAALRSSCAKEGVAVETALLGAWALALGRAALRDDVVFGIQVSGRPPELGEDLVGPLANVLPLRVRLPPAAPASWLREVEARRRRLDRYGHTPLAQVRTWSEVPLNLPLFESLVVFEEGPAWPEGLALELRPMRTAETAPYPLTLRGRLSGELDLRLSADGSRFGAASCERLLARVRTLLAALAEGASPGLGETERHLLLREWNDTRRPGVGPELIHELIEAQARRAPDAPALAFEDRVLTYLELDAQANRLANRLRRLGVGPEVIVGLALERSPELIVGLLGILKAGGAYLPLDPAYPQPRLAFMMEDSGIRLLVTEPGLAGNLPAQGVCHVLLEPGLPSLAGESAERPESGAGPESLAYSIYTSGSTGRPKGALLRHGGLRNLAQAQVEALGIGPGDRVLQFAPLSFDASIWEIVMALRVGATLCLARRESLVPGPGFTALLRRLGITAVTLPPSALAATPWESLPALRTLVCAGEALPQELVDRWGPGRRFWNAYGPTEVTVWSSIAPCPPGSRPHIGRPILNTRTWLVDANLEIVPAGVPGEMLVGGAGIARGYLGRPDLTAERFVPDPWSGEPGARLYRTGDLARLLPDGNLDFAGRLDHQVKVRGIRVEVAEVESALRRLPGVREAVADAREDGSGGKRLIAWIVPVEGEGRPRQESLRQGLRQQLPEHMVPSAFVLLERLPATPSGKLDRRALPDPREDGPRPEAIFDRPRTQAEGRIAAIWKGLLQRDAVGIQDSFFDLGGHSLLLGRLLVELQDAFECRLEMIDLFQYPTISAMAGFLAGRLEEPAVVPAVTVEEEPAAPPVDGIAVIGMAGRFPGAANVQEFWRNIADGVECITFFSDADMIAAGLPESALANPDLVKARGAVEGIELFDEGFFGMSPAEAEITDPQQRLFLEIAWEALESAGYDPAAFPGAIGVYAGCSYSTYWLHHLHGNPRLSGSMGIQVDLANDKDFLPTRVSYKLNLKGPSLGVQTSCSTSLVAIHQACQALLGGECDMALAGGASIVCGQGRGYFYQEGSILSPDGHCRAFDAQARGTVPGSGVGAVVLKRLDRALADGDHVHAVIRGSAINNDGSYKMGFTAPSIDGQREAVATALARARVHPETVTLVETHGTGTELGDPIEIAALSQAFGSSGKGYCAIGSIKTGIGHLDVAAGVAGFIKAVLALEHKALPPSLNYERPNPGIDFENSPFYVNTRLAEWRNGGHPRRAGVSSFGIGGTNAHVVLEEAPAAEAAAPSRPHHLLLLSARSDAALDAAAARLAGHLRSHPGLSLADVAFTLQVGRRAFKHRRALVCGTPEEAAALLDSRGGASAVRDSPQDRPVAFLFPGQGSQRAGMTREIYASEPVFRQELDRCTALLAPHLGTDLRAELASDRLGSTWLAQPALFAVEYALARLWMSWGVRPRAMIGHSIGEYTAACLAGVFTLEAALELVARRGRLMQQLPGGAMLAVALPPDEVRPLLGADLSLAAVNEPSRSVVSGPLAAVEALERELTGREVFCRRLRASHAFHSAMMEPILGAFEAEVARARPQAPRIPFVSNLTGTWITAEQATDPAYWSRHLRQTVLFGQGVRELLHAPSPILLEVGPGKALTDAVLCRGDRPADLAAVPSLGGGEGSPETAVLLQAAGRLWLAGAPVDWSGFHAGERRRRVPLPAYPFERRRHWIERSAAPERKSSEPQEDAMEQSHGDVVPADGRRGRIRSRLRDLCAGLTGRPSGEIPEDESFLDMGLDSLRLIEASHQVEKAFGVKLPFRRLMEDLSTLASLADGLDGILPPEALPAPVAVAQPAPTTATMPPPPQSDLQALLARQLDAMNRQSQALTQVIAMQLDALAGGGAPAPPSVAIPAQAPQRKPALAPDRPAGSEPAPYVPYQRIQTGGSADLNPRQQQHLEALIARLSSRLAGSKRLAQEGRPFLADSRGPMGFRLLWKELVFPLYARRGQGARIWDVDGNEYVDLIMGFGSLLLGHSPSFLADALREQSGQGLLIGMESPHAGRAAQLICEMTGNERASFTNSGTEAVMAALRLARAKTGRTRIAVFEGGYHGFSDDVMVLPATGPDGRPGSAPLAPGVPPRVAEGVMALKYCHPESLRVLEECAHGLAAILIEPQQSRRPGSFDTPAFLRELRRIADASGAALILDEVITGFRIHQGGAQAAYGVRADMVTYGKGIGVGMAVGCVAGKAAYLDAIDGGAWSYGDGSFPQAEVTFIAGTYFKHPLIMPAVRAVLEHMREQGPALQERMTAGAERLARELNGYFDRERLPMRVLQADSICSLLLGPEIKHPPLFFYHLLENGVYALNRRPLFLSTAHTDEDLDFVVEAVRRSVDALREGDFLPPGPAGARPPEGPRRVPATESQRELFTLVRIGDDASRAYNEGVKLRLRGPLRAGALRQALGEVVARHEALRATFADEGDDLRIHPRMEVELPLDDLSLLAADAREARAAEVLRAEADLTFDFAAGPLFRFRLLRLAEDDHVLAATFSHLVVDGLSIDVLFDEAFALYEAACRGARAELPAPTPFGDYAAWLRSRQDGADMEAAERFWLAELAGAPLLELPADHPRPAVQGYDGGRRSLPVGAPLLEDLQRLSRARGCTLFVTVFAIFQVLLHRLSGQSDLVAATASAGQAAMGGERLVGHCVSLLPFRSRLPEDARFADLAPAVRGKLFSLYEYQHYPFSRLLRKLGLQGSTSRSPVSAVMNLDSASSGGSKVLDLAVESGANPSRGAKFEIFFDVAVHADGLRVDCSYQTGLFLGSTIERWLAYFRNLLAAVVARPEEPLWRLSFLPEAEVRQLLGEWSGRTAGYPRDACLHELFAARVARTPEAVAAVCGEERLTYGDLDDRSNRLARHLRRLGVGPEVCVGLATERSLEMVVGALGILKAGGAYLPLDLSYPGERLAFMLADAGVRVILTQERLRESLPGRSCPAVCLDSDWEEIARHSPAALRSGAGAESLAYVMYTSGSTGRPKGVQVTHRNVARLVQGADYADLGPGEVILQLAPISFDASTFEIWGSLLNGGCLAILPLRVPSLEELGQALRRHAVTTLWLTAGLFHQMVEERLEDLGGLRQLLAGGDVLSASHVRRVLDRLRGVTLINGYGPTENTTFTACHPMRSGDRIEGPVPLGRPIANTRVFILDRHLAPVPAGVAGQLCASGDGLSRGYLGRPDLTAETFVPHPFGDRPGDRLYLVGDLARWLPDGRIEFLGRIDRQVKVRGFRIEPGEIEAALRMHPAVRDAAVLVQEGDAGDRRLAAFLVAAGPWESGELAGFLKARLPEYMVPASFVLLEALPLNANGKVDRGALAATGAPASGGAEDFQAPRDPVEAKLARIWGEVLGIERVGVHDGFFESGGHSLLATRLISRIERAFEVSLPLRELFEAPTIAGLAPRIAARLSSGRRLPRIERIPRDGDLVASFAQERLWFVDRLLGGRSAAYNIDMGWRLSGPLDETALERSLEEIVRRHEVLRTRFSYRGKRLLQTISPAGKLLLTIDLRGLPEPGRETELLRRAEAEALQPFDLDAAPLIRATLVLLKEGAAALLVTMHHIASDGWSTGVFFEELTTLYKAFAGGRPSPLPELPVQYADFAAWQRAWLAGEVLDEQLSFWRRRLAGVSSLEMPTDHPRPAVQVFRGEQLSFHWSGERLGALYALSQRQGATLYMSLLAAFQVLLSRWTGQADIVVGTPIANRHQPEIEKLIGLFVNTLAMRGSIDGNGTFLELLESTIDDCLEAFAHQDLPFEKLVEDLRPERDLTRNPIVQVGFALQNTPAPDVATGELTFSLLPVETRSTRFDLEVHLQESRGVLHAFLIYDADLFEAPAMNRLAGHFERLVEGIVADPGRPVSLLPMLGDAELDQVLRGWSGERRPLPEPALIHELFAARAAAAPDRVAVVLGERSMTYGELDVRSNQLARRLQELGVGPEVSVGLSMERSLEMVIGLLGILKAGGAYVPLDPAYPSERLAFMVEDSRIAVLVTQEHLQAGLPESAVPVCLDAGWELIGRRSPAPVRSGVRDGNLAYMTYTSGSTGRPKGVQVTHRNVVRLVRDTSYARFGEDQVTLQLAPVAFDASTFEIWGSLLNGGRLVLLPVRVPSLEELGRAVRRHGIDTLFMTTGLFHQMVEERLEDFAGVRQLLAGGDVMSVAHVRKVVDTLKSLRLIVCYGPTENTTFTTCDPLESSAAVGDTVSLGRPITNTEVFVLDRFLEPVPIGVAGELCTGGEGLSRGYFGRPDLTAEKFGPHPFSSRPGQRLYRTGDRARWLPDGRLEFLGRFDRQVKVRGFRIEPGEIEIALLNHELVREAAVLALPDPSGNRRLAAYVVTAEETRPAAAEMAEYLKGILPPHMVPSFFVFLNRLPLTPNGKLDRQALPPPETSAEDGAGPMAPRTPVEAKLVEIWQQVLDREPIGVDDDFFELGGHSLLATQVIASVRKELDLDIELRVLFEEPTVAGFAAWIEREIPGAAMPLIRPVERGGDLPLSFAQQRLWFLDQLTPENASYNIVAAWRLMGPLQVGTLRRVLGEIVRRHEALRTRVLTRAGQPSQVIDPPGAPAFLVVDLTALDEGRKGALAERLAREEGLRPFNLARPLLRATLLRSSGEESVLLVNMHHVVSDGWSLGILMGELAAIYEALLHGRPSPLPELPFQYADFAVWQRAWMSGPELEKQVGYWNRQLADAAVLALPADHPRLPLQAFRAGVLPVRIRPAVLRTLQSLSRRARATLYMTLLAVFQALLRRWTGQRDIVVGTPIANRNQPDTDKLIGFFVNTLAMRSNVAGDPLFPLFLERTAEVCLGAQAHQDLPFEKLVDSLQVERDLSRTPLVQAVFALQNATAGALRMAGLEVLPFSENAHTTRFDLEVHLWEKGDSTGGTLLYDKDLFEERTVERLLESYLALLAGIAENPDRRLSELPLLGEAEARQMLVDWNCARADYDREACLHHLFEAQAVRRPDAIAVASEAGSLTYDELNAWSNRLAHRLIGLGVGPRTLVGVCIHPSPEMVVALMGVLKAGGAYVPIDPGYPRERIEYILDDIQAPVWVTSSRVAAGLPGRKGASVRLDEDRLAGMSAENPPARAGADDLAYVIFTSGSTGRPKGVMLQHRPVVNLIAWVNRTFDVGPADRVLQVASMTFDLSVYDMFGLLAAGGSVRVASEEELADPRRLAAILDSGEITFWDSAPAALQQLVPLLPEEGRGSPRLRLAFLSGDWIPLTLPPALQRAFPNVRVIGLGGATEAAIWSNWHAVEEIRPEWASVPYGRAIQNARYYVLDRDLQPCPLGVAGDLYIGGECLSLGYFNQPALTAERYVPDPFGGRPGGVLYATGDRARWKAAGHIEFLGRLDAQVKLRGYRIELGEIESVLLEHAAVHHALALVREDQPGARRLVAYALTGRGDDPALAEELRELLKSRLPSYMVPSAVLTLASLPLTPNGKVDRKALPAPEQARGGEGGLTAPRTATEARLAEIWSAVLARGPVGVQENFFEIGGDSILGILVVAMALRAGLSVSPRQIFEHQTIADLAAALDSGGAEAADSDAPPEPDRPFSLARLDAATLDRLLAAEPGIADLYPLSPMQRDMLVHSLAFPRSDVNVLQFVWSSRGRLDVAALQRAWQMVIARHDALRTAFRWQGLEEPHQAVFRDVDLPWQEHDWRELSAGQVKARLAAFLEEDRARGFRLDGPPPSRLSFLRLADGSGHLVWSVHHALLDGWSLAVVEGQVSSLYEALREGSEPEPAPAPAYRGYIAWLERQDLERAEAFWRETLRGLRAPTPLWIDKLPPAAGRRDGFDRRSLRLPAAATAGLERLARRSRVTPSTILQGAWALLLARYSGQDEVVFGITVSGRAADLEGSESMVGLFLNNLPARVPVPPDACLAGWLGELQGRASGLWRYEHTPQSKIRSWSEIPGALPLYDSMVVFGNFPSDPSAPQTLAPESQLQDDQGVDESTYFGARTSSRMTLLSQPAPRLPLHLVYESRSFDPATVDRALGHLATLLEGLAEAGDDQLLGGLPLLTGAEQQQLLREDPLLLDARGRLVPVGVPGASSEDSGRLARRLPDGRLQELGDLRRTAMAAGQRLLPEMVEAALREHPALGEAAVLIREASPGQPHLAAYAVAAREPAPGLAEIQGFLRERLPWHLIPPELLLVPGVPRQADGEVDREALQALEPVRSASRLQDLGRNLLFQDSLEVQLLLILEEVFQLRPISADTSFFDLGGSSVLAVSLVDKIERRLGVELPLSLLFERSTARGLARALREQAGDLPWSPLVRIKPGGSRTPFFCVHAAGGNVLGFGDLVRHLDPEQPFHALQSIGLDGRQEPPGSIEEMAARYVDEIRTVQPRGPYLLGGHSFGGYVAHEMACQLERQGEPVALLAALDSWSPVFQGRPVLGETIPDDAGVLVEIAAQAAGRDGVVTREEVEARESAERLDFILERIQACAPEAGVDSGRRRRLLKIQTSAVEAMRTWVPRPCRARIVVFRALEEEPGLARVNRHPALGTPDLYRGWSALTQDRVEVCDVPGNHGTMVVEPHVRELARQLGECLARAPETAMV